MVNEDVLNNLGVGIFRWFPGWCNGFIVTIPMVVLHLCAFVKSTWN